MHESCTKNRLDLMVFLGSMTDYPHFHLPQLSEGTGLAQNGISEELVDHLNEQIRVSTCMKFCQFAHS